MEAEWAYISYASDEHWDVRIGRLLAPLFAYSDHLDAGYAYPWITPPLETYRFILSTVEGLDTLYRFQTGDWRHTAQVFYGRLSKDTTLEGEEVDMDLTDFAGANLTMNRDWLTFRLAAATISNASTLQIGRKTLPDGTRLVPVNLNHDRATRNEFNRVVLDKSDSQLRAYWSRLVFTGRAQPPRDVGSQDDVIELIRRNPGMIGYVDTRSLTEGVRVLKRFP